MTSYKISQDMLDKDKLELDYLLACNVIYAYSISNNVVNVWFSKDDISKSKLLCKVCW